MDWRPYFIDSGAPGRGCAYRLPDKPDGVLQDQPTSTTSYGLCQQHQQLIMVSIGTTESVTSGTTVFVKSDHNLS